MLERPVTADFANLDRRLASFEPVGLTEMDRVALLSRTDTKYLLRLEDLIDLLPALREHYQTLTVAGARLSPYETLYFDTPDYWLFKRHQAGVRNRYKVRSRRYVQTQMAFFEVKHKVNKNYTVKDRIATRELLTRVDGDTAAFLGSHLPAAVTGLEPKLWNTYWRVTLVNRVFPERVTLDLGLAFSRDSDDLTLSGLVTAEVKQAGRPRPTPFIRCMHQAHLRPGGFSKYCLGISLLVPDLIHNNFNRQLRAIAALTDRGRHVCH